MLRGMAIIIGAAALFVGCSDSDPVGGGADRTYSASVAGGVTGTLQGSAYFGSGEFEGGMGFAIVLGGESSDHTIVLGRTGTARPGKGEYAFQAPTGETQAGDAWTGVYIYSDDDELLGTFWTTSGTLRVTESTASRFKGTFQFEGVGFLVENYEEEVEITVSGSFDAGAATSAAMTVTHTLTPR